MKHLINKFGLLFLFLDNLYLPIDLGFDFRINYILQGFFILYFCLTRPKVKLSLNFLISFLAVAFLLFLVALFKQVHVFGFIKQFFLITFQLVYAYALINSYKYDFKRITKDYLSIVYLACWIAVAQFILMAIGYPKLADLSYLGFNMGNFSTADRIPSWFEEPSFLAYAIIPAVFIALSRFFRLHNFMSIKNALLVIIVLVLSKSSVGLLGILLSLIVIVFTKYPIIKRPLYLTVIIIIIPITSYFIYTIPAVKFRVDDTFALFAKDNVSKSDINKTNLSTYALFSNYRVTKEAFSHNPILGTGIGSYETNYDLYINKVIPKTRTREKYPLNKMDANSLLMRLLVEGGLLSVVCLIVFSFKNRLSFSFINPNQRIFWAFNNGIFVLIILRLLRQGHYTSLGFVMFIVLFYLLNRHNKYVGKSNRFEDKTSYRN